MLPLLLLLLSLLTKLRLYRCLHAALFCCCCATAAVLLLCDAVPRKQVDAAAESIASDRITPVFAVSNVSGTGLPLLRAFVARLRRNKARNDDPTMQVNESTGQRGQRLSIWSAGCGHEQ